MLRTKIVATFSIVGCDLQTQEWGIAVQSRFLGVGAVVPWAQTGVGAVATQSYAHTGFGPEGLALMGQGVTAEDTLGRLLAADPDREKRQVGLVDAQGNGATFTGAECYRWAGGVSGPGYAAQGNILVGQETVTEMATTFTSSTGNLGHRLLLALEAGQRAGGDSRGQQSAALLVVRPEGGYGGYNDRAADLRVDDHVQPIAELRRIYQLHQLYFQKTAPGDVLSIEGEVLKNLRSHLLALGYLPDTHADATLVYQRLVDYIATENFEERLQPEGQIDREVLAYMARQAEGTS